MSHQDAHRAPRHAFITGAASGLGLAFARALAAEGWHVGLADIDGAALAAAAATLPGPTPLLYVFDVGDADAFQDAAASFLTHTGTVDLAINNAGIAMAGLFEEHTGADWEALVRVNLMGVIHGCQAFVPVMCAQGSGTILNIASAAAIAAGPFMAAYNVTKAGVLALSETLYAELHDAGVHVAVALPTFFQTNIAAHQRGSDEHRQITARLLERSQLTADAVATEILRQARRGTMHILVPRAASRIWHLKRLAPRTYLKTTVKLFRKTRSYLQHRRTAPPETAAAASVENKPMG